MFSTKRKTSTCQNPSVPELANEGAAGTNSSQAHLDFIDNLDIDPQTKVTGLPKMSHCRDVQAMSDGETKTPPTMLSRDSDSIFQIILDFMSSYSTRPCQAPATFFKHQCENFETGTSKTVKINLLTNFTSILKEILPKKPSGAGVVMMPLPRSKNQAQSSLKRCFSPNFQRIQSSPTSSARLSLILTTIFTRVALSSGAMSLPPSSPQKHSFASF